MSLIGEDCHYFITAGCTRGNQCCFRHQPAARLTENPCPEWIQGKCLNPNCSLRHIPVDRSNFKRKAATPCFYENQPNGCLNPHCQFLHTKKSKVPGVTPAVALELPKTTQLEASVTAPKTIYVPAATASQVTSIETSKTTVGATLIPPPPAPVHSLPPALGTPTIVNGVLTIAPSRGILGPTPNQVQVPSVQLLPPLVTHHAAVRAKFIGKNNASGVDPSCLPKTGHFNEQVRLFKEMLSAKKNIQRNNVDNGDKQYIDSDSFSSSEEELEERKSRGKNKKKSKKGNRNRSKKRSKEAFSKDEEFLYGDFKDVPLDKKHKKSKNDRKGHDTDVQVKSYEQVLREKALRKMMEKKRKEKFDNDFEDILHAEVERKKSRRKRSKSDGDEDVELEKSRKESIDLSGFVFSKEDAVELAVDEDEFDNEETSVKKKSKKRKEQNEKEPESKKTKSSNPEARENELGIENTKIEAEEKESTEDGGVLIIPDETTDLTFSVDDTDDLALELNQEPETFQSKKRRKATVITKKVTSSVNRVSRTSDVRKNNLKNSRIKTSGANRLDQKPKTKRNVLVVDSDSTTDEKKAEKVEFTEGKKVISLARREDKKKDPKNEPKQTADSIKIKTFEEIMAEKRKRKMQSDDVVVLSDGGSPPKRCDGILKERSEKFKSAVLKTETSVDNANNDSGSPKKSASQIRREKLQLAKEEYEKKRRSIQLYQVKSLQGQKIARETTVNDISATATSSDAALVKKVKLQRQNVQKTSDTGAVSVRSFEEIMKEKKLRKQQQHQQQQQHTQVQQKRVDTKPLQSFLRRRSLSNQRNVQQEQANKTTPAESDESNNVSVKAVTSLPVAKVIGRRRSSSPSPVPQGDSKTAPVKLRRNLSNSDNKLPNISPLPGVNGSTEMEKVKDEADEKMPSNVIASVAVDEKIKNTVETTINQPVLPESSREDIQEALDEKKRLHAQDMLSDDEFEKEMNDLLSDGEDDDVDGDVNDDDFMMELEQMIDS